MIAINLMLLIPLMGMLFFVFFGRLKISGAINILFSIATFIDSLFLAIHLLKNGPILCLGKQIYIDALSVILIVLTTFVSSTVAIFSSNYMRQNLDSGRITAKLLQLYYIMFQAFIGTVLLVYATNNIGLLWVAMEGATLATVLLVSLYRTPESIEAAWKYFILCIVGIALALFGTICIYFSSIKLPITADAAMLWTVLHQHAALLDPHVLTIGFVFLLVGYGTKVGLVPLHFWLPDAHSESPAPMSALLSGLLLNIGVYALIRFKMLIDPGLSNQLTNNMLLAFGFVSFLIAGFFIYRQKNIKRMFSYSSIEHMGLITFAFGLNTPLTSFIGLFYVIIHSLVKSAIFMSVGNVIQLVKNQNMDKIRGLIQLKPIVGWTLLFGLIAIAGFPPFGIFNSEFLLFIASTQKNILFSILLILGLLIAMAGLFKNLHPVLFGKNTDEELPTTKVCTLPSVLNLSIALYLGLHIPHVLMLLLNQATVAIAGGGITL
ncbi:MAG: hydrogenase 4 subunit F [Gammaproteobacteria bacterium]|nr:hydrogenase 4 subunit F [Gammaproteobacteria bacterium]